MYDKRSRSLLYHTEYNRQKAKENGKCKNHICLEYNIVA